MSSTALAWHVYPEEDLIEHEMLSDCVCQPVRTFAFNEERQSFVAVYTHSSLDGREKFE